ncbi:MAG: tetratricopeptide repeat protein [Planctomycetota bacterium]
MKAILALLAVAGPLWTGCVSSPSPHPNLTAHELLAAGQPTEAAAHLDQHGAADDPMASLLRAESAFRVGDYDRAVARYTDALGRELAEPARGLARRNLAAALRAAGRPADAYAVLEGLAADEGSSDELELHLGICAVESAQLDRAREHFSRLPEAEREHVAEVLGRDFLSGAGGPEVQP